MRTATSTVGLLVYAALATALPAAEDSSKSKLVEIHREPASQGGHLIWFGHNNTDTNSNGNGLARRDDCGTTAAPVCASDHAARNDVCGTLVNELAGDGGVAVPQAPRQVCLLGDAATQNAYCCMSWHTVVPGLTKLDLAGYAQTMLSTCTANGVSGRINNIKVHDTCTSVCMSNRGTHC